MNNGLDEIDRRDVDHLDAKLEALKLDSDEAGDALKLDKVVKNISAVRTHGLHDELLDLTKKYHGEVEELESKEALDTLEEIRDRIDRRLDLIRGNRG